MQQVLCIVVAQERPQNAWRGRNGSSFGRPFLEGGGFSKVSLSRKARLHDAFFLQPRRHVQWKCCQGRVFPRWRGKAESGHTKSREMHNDVGQGAWRIHEGMVA